MMKQQIRRAPFKETLRFVTGIMVLTLLLTDTGCTKDWRGYQEVNTTASRTRAHEFPQGLEWLNTAEPLELEQLRGKVVLLDFWTYCCINCIHIIPDLKKLEHKYKEELVVIGVHSAKFFTEQGTDNIRQAILRYDLEHPVVNDKDLKFWKRYGARAWPTLVLIDPEGYLVTRRSGEQIYSYFDNAIQAVVKQFDDQIDRTVPDFALEKEVTPATYLKFPGKVTVDANNNRLYISDSNNNRIVITDLKGQLIDVIGSGEAGATDGGFDNASFFRPQGTVSRDSLLYIADTENHLIRVANLSAKTVKTIAGTGKQVYVRRPDGPAKSVGLNSPWDLAVHSDFLYIAMAGSHQLWKLNLQSGHITLHAGSGYENIVDAPLREAQLAQPSGIVARSEKLYFVDSEVSAVRTADIAFDGRVSTIIGHGLFEYGDKDGNHRQARFQHPLGITAVDDQLYVADTYNNKVKRINPKERISVTYAGTGEPGMHDGALENATFDEPGGISATKDLLYIADTNNHLIRVIEMSTGTVSTLKIRGMRPSNTVSKIDTAGFTGVNQVFDTVDLSVLKQISVNLKLPQGMKLNPLADSQGRIVTASGTRQKAFDITSTSIRVDVGDWDSAESLLIEMVIYFCHKDNEGLCFIENLLFELRNGGRQRETFTIEHTIDEVRL